MHHLTADQSPTGDPDALARLRHAVEHAAHLLPAQGPINVFIHHNTLHAFEHLPFDEAVRRGAETFGCQPYLSEDRFREALGRGRIRFANLRAVLGDDLGDRGGDPVPPHGTRVGLRLAMLQNALPTGTADELRWFVEVSDALRKVQPGTSAADRAHLIAETRHWVMRDLRAWDGSAREAPRWVPALFAKFREARIEAWDDATWEAFSLESLWGVCRAGVGALPERPVAGAPRLRHRDLMLRVAGVDPDLWIHSLLIRFCAAFLDQGVSHWLLPDRDRGFFHAFCSVYRATAGPPDRWFRGVRGELARLQDARIEPLQSLAESLAELGVEEAEWPEYLSTTLLALRGWSGMIHEAEERSDRFTFPAPADSLVGFLAVRLLLERFACAHVARDALGYAGPLAGLRDFLHARIAAPLSPEVEERALPLFLLAQALGWTPPELYHLSPGDWAVLVHEIEAFDSIERRRLFHLAYERRFREQTLDALALHTRRSAECEVRSAESILAETAPRSRFQVVTCIDEREESFRRHLEEIAPNCETFGTAGFFGVVMYYRGAAEAHYTPLCPVVVHPKHWVEEQPGETHAESDRRTRRFRRALGRTSHQFHLGTRGFALGAVITAGVDRATATPRRLVRPRAEENPLAVGTDRSDARLGRRGHWVYHR